ncbi:hypothetical protein A11S_2001 [Micavibrio aeruginosavorus EPB]|uniref:Uncharacterized protein n=2 Tax=Micavibrio aeruginosavorus TaxID=349221 RepID=M4VL10_9BACT|nr:hypothetical protein [Micavibrio aeruginosavorus]AGH98801.1 hypothetical protein A11S_2001 [Micavibrio aeruginosavorus EPB]
MAALLLNAVPSWAQDVNGIQVVDPVAEQISYLQNEWSRIKYQIPDDEEKLAAIHRLEAHAASVTASFQDRPEPKIWEAIILSTDAGIVKGMSALPKVKKARDLLEQAEKIDERALDGSAHTSLGSLYYQVPGWPVGFGDDDLAEEHLRKALVINPNGIDPNYFYGDFLIQDGRYDEAATYLKRALQAPDRPGRALADAGRRQEIKAALAKIDEKKKTGEGGYN